MRGCTPLIDAGEDRCGDAALPCMAAEEVPVTLKVAALSSQAWKAQLEVKTPSLSVYVPAACCDGSVHEVANFAGLPATKLTGLFHACHILAPALL